MTSPTRTPAAPDPGASLDPGDPRLAPWRAFLEAHARVSRQLDEELRSEHDLSIAEYDALLSIAEAPGRRIRMRPLSDRLTLTKSGVTRLIDRLVADGLVERGTCLEDARGAEACLTDRGLERLRRASKTHLRGVSEHFLEPLAGYDMNALGDAMRVVSERASSDPMAPEACGPSGHGADDPA